EKPSIGVHVRGRDFFTQGPGRGNTLTQEYYDLALDYMKNHTKNPSLYVFSDDPEWAKENVRFDEPTEYVSTDYGTNENQDLYLMSKCDHVITANSTFSWWSAWLNENPDKKVTVPSPWKPHGYPRGIVKKWDLTPDSWKIIEWR
ncbi:MAG: alpha-1,2-fucosyltransferase, partial [Halobacteria archaeon]